DRATQKTRSYLSSTQHATLRPADNFSIGVDLFSVQQRRLHNTKKSTARVWRKLVTEEEAFGLHFKRLFRIPNHEIGVAARSDLTFSRQGGQLRRSPAEPIGDILNSNAAFASAGPHQREHELQ